jgi:hypothetical protein
MSIKLLVAPLVDERDAAIPWKYCRSLKVNAFRTEGAEAEPFLPVDSGYEPSADFLKQINSGRCLRGVQAHDTAFSKIVNGQLKPCSDSEDERIMLITMRGAWMQYLRNIDLVNVEPILQLESRILGYPAAHLVVRLDRADGYVSAELTTNQHVDNVLIFEWDGVKKITLEEFDNWMRSDALTINL